MHLVVEDAAAGREAGGWRRSQRRAATAGRGAGEVWLECLASGEFTRVDEPDDERLEGARWRGPWTGPAWSSAAAGAAAAATGDSRPTEMRLSDWRGRTFWSPMPARVRSRAAAAKAKIPPDLGLRTVAEPAAGLGEIGLRGAAVPGGAGGRLDGRDLGAGLGGGRGRGSDELPGRDELLGSRPREEIVCVGQRFVNGGGAGRVGNCCHLRGGQRRSVLGRGGSGFGFGGGRFKYEGGQRRHTQAATRSEERDAKK